MTTKDAREARSSRNLLAKAVKLSGLSDRQFARQRLGINERTFRRYKDGSSKIPSSKLAHLRTILTLAGDSND